MPGRNLLFLTFAAALAYRRGLSVLVGGMCETDFSGYPDCRDNTLKALQVAISLGLDAPMTIETPLMWLDQGADLGAGRTARRRGADRCSSSSTPTPATSATAAQRHAWGYGCGRCPACALRRQGYEGWR